MPHPATPKLFDLSGKKFLVVGGARNLGFDMALALAECGAEGVVTSRLLESATEAAAKIADLTTRVVHGIGLDANRESSVRAGVALAVRLLGRIDILINSVGGGGGGANTGSTRFEDRQLASWNRIQRINVTAPFLVCKYVAPIMMKRRTGSIINIASVAGVVGRDRRIYPKGMTPQSVDYAAAKAAVIGFSTDLAAYLGPEGIRVNAISPGGFERGQPQAFIKAYSKRCMLGRMGRDGVDLKGAAVFLASDASAYITGQNLIVDGGFTCWR